MKLSDDFLQRVWIAAYAVAYDRERSTASPDERHFLRPETFALRASALADSAVLGLVQSVVGLPPMTAFPTIPNA